MATIARKQIVDKVDEIKAKVIADTESADYVSHAGYIKRTAADIIAISRAAAQGPASGRKHQGRGLSRN